MHIPEDVASLPYAQYLTKHEGSLASKHNYDAIHFDGLEFADNDAHNSRFIECAFTDTVLSRSIYRRACFNNVWAKNLRILDSDLTEGEWSDFIMVSSSIAALEAFGTQFRRVTLQRCKLDSVNFRDTTLTEVDFVDCVLHNVDWSGATLTNVRFPGSSLQGVHFSKANFTKVDFRGARDLDLASGYDSLKGCIINNSQLIELAPFLAATLGIVVKGD